MVGNDYDYFRKCHDLGLVSGELLEIGSAKIEGQSGNICDLARSMGIRKAVGADLQPGLGVDFAADFSAETFQSTWKLGEYDTVVIFNVLEHTFDPISVLRNAAFCLKPGGWILMVVPVVWPIHNFPADYSRLLPDWFREFARRQHLLISPEAFCWLTQFGIVTVGEKEQNELPSFLNLGKTSHAFKYWRSRIAHKLLDTYGRSHWFGHCAIGAALQKPR